MLVNTLTYAGVAAVFLVVVKWYLDDRKIHQLGGRSAIKPSRFFGFSTVWEVIQSTKGTDKSILLWDNFLRRWAHPARPYTVECVAAGERFIFTVDPENIKAVLATQFDHYGKGKAFNDGWHDFLGDSIFSTDGEKWHASRQLIRPQFIKERVSDLACFERHNQLLLLKLGGKGEEVDVKDFFFRYTLDVVGEFLLGHNIGSLNNAQVAFAEAFQEIFRLQIFIARLGPLHRFYPRRTFRKHIATLNAFVSPFIDATLALPPSELEKRTKSDEGYTFLHALAIFTRDRTVLRDQLVAVLLAGRDTTACTLTWLFAELSRHPDVVASLRQEIISVVGPHRAPTYDDLKRLKHLSHAISETLRLHAIVPFNVRIALRDTTLPVGGGPDGLAPVGVPKGTPIAYSTQIMQTTRDFYPPTSPDFPDPAIFAPRRWERWTPRPWEYLPFNGGPRICIGQQFALTEVAYTVVRILQRFERVESRMGEEVMKPWSEAKEGESLAEHRHRTGFDIKNEVILTPAQPIKVAFYEAE